MDGSDMAFDYKAVAAGIARSEGMGALLPVVEKELLHYRILSAMQDGGFFGPIRSEERRVGKECRSRWSPYN